MLMDKWMPCMPMFKWKDVRNFIRMVLTWEEQRKIKSCGWCRFSKVRWLIAREEECENGQRYFNVGKLVNGTITSDVQALMVGKFDQEVKVDQEALLTDVKNTLAGGLRNVGRQGESRSVERSNKSHR